MRPKNEKPLCDFVRSILSLETGAKLEVVARPDRERRMTEEVEELWASSKHSFAIEHTLLESFVGQLTDDAKFVRLIAPLEPLLAGRLPGTYSLAVDVGAATNARLRYEDAQIQIIAAVLAAAPALEVGQAVTLVPESLPFPVHLYRRNKNGSKVLVRRFITEDVESSRLARVRQALESKCPKLAAARRDGHVSILALESNDIALSNYDLVGRAVKQALEERNDAPDLAMVVETDGGPFYGWVIRNGTGIGLRRFGYTEGQF